jgi:predicted outer membrane repeat protein
LQFSNCNTSSIGALYVSLIDDTTNPQVIENSVFINNEATWGAAILIEEAKFLLRNVSFLHNHAKYGAGLYVHAGASIDVQSCFFDNNTASDGGAVYMYGGQLQISDSELRNNFALDTGGAIATSQDSQMVVLDTLFQENAAGGQGGGIYSVNPLRVERCRFISNYVTEDGDGHPSISFFMGSAIMVSSDDDGLSQVVLRDNLFYQNYIQPTVNSYGTVGLIGRSILIERCQFIDNTAWKGAGAYLQNPEDESRIVDSVFNSGLGLIGAGLYFTSYDGLHNLTVERTLFDANDGRALHADEFERRMVAGAAIATNGPLQLKLKDSTVVNNYCLVDDGNPHQANDTIYGCAILFEDRDDELFTSSLMISNTTFRGNVAVGGSAVRGAAIGILIVRQIEVSIVGSTFDNNTCDCSRSGCFSYGAGVVSSMASGVTPANRITLTIEDSSFERHYSNNGALWLEDSTSMLRRVLIKQNVGKDIVGGVQVFNGDGAFGPFDRTYTFEDCIFDANYARQIIRPLSESGYHDLMIYSHGDTDMVYSYMVGNNRFLNHRANISVLFGSSITLSRNSALQYKRTPTTPAVVEIPPILQFGTTDLDLREVSATIECLKLWWSSGEDYGFNTVRVGAYDVTALRSNSFHHSSVIGAGTELGNGRFILRDRSYTVGDTTPKVFSSITVVNEGRMEHYACNITLDNSQVINQAGALWSMPLYNPPSILLGPGRFQNFGKMLLSTGVFRDIELSLASSSQMTYQLTNFWKPSELSLVGSSSVSLGGSLVVDSNPMREFSEANNQQLFTLIRATSLSGSVLLSDVGGYRMRSITSPRELSVVVTNFYPHKAQMNDDGSRISVLFPRPTNAPESRDCSLIFDAVTAASFSPGSECSWTSETTLLIKSTRHNGRLTMLAGVVRDVKDPLFFVPSATIDIVQSSSPLSPEIVLVAPSVHPSCSDLIVDASASFHLGDPSRASFTWSTSTASPQLSAFLSTLPKTESKISIPSRFFDQRTGESWSFSLEITNTMSQKSTQIFSVQVVPDAVPVVYIEGPTRREVVSAFDTQIYTRVQLPACVASSLLGRKFLRQWESVGSDGLECQPTGLTEFSLFLPKGCLKPAASYTFKFSVWPEENPSLKVSQSVTVTTQFSPIGLDSVGMSGLADANRPIRLEVVVIDADTKYWNGPTTYSWQVLACPGRGQLASISSSELASAYLKRQQKASASKGSSEVDIPVFDPDNDVVCEGPDGKQFMIPPMNSSVVSFGASFLPRGEFLFGVTAHRGDRFASELIYLNVSSFSASAIARTVAIRTQQRTLKTLAQERLVLKAYIDGANGAPQGLTVRWSDEIESSNFVSNSSSTFFATDLSPSLSHVFH